MAFPTGMTTYTILGVTIARSVDEGGHEPWLYPDLEYTKDVVLGGGLSYLDSGANVYPPLSFRASCLSGADRQALINALGTTATLTNSRGHSDTVTIVKARPINQGNNREYWLDLTFELRP